jgi:hypothetical protein
VFTFAEGKQAYEIIESKQKISALIDLLYCLVFISVGSKWGVTESKVKNMYEQKAGFPQWCSGES